MIQRRDHLRASGTPTTPRRKTSVGIVGGLAAVGLFAGLIGCGGGGGGKPGGTSTTGTTTATTTAGTAVATVNLSNTPGLINFTFLTGAGRAAGDRTAIVRRLTVTDESGATAETRLEGELRLVLNRYSSQILGLNVPTLTGSSRLFTNVQLDVLRFETQQLNSDGDLETTPYSSVVNLPADFDSNIRTFAGRSTHVPFYLDNDVIETDGTTATFSLTNFQAINFRSGAGTTIQGTLADYVAFNISNITAGKPSLKNGNVANRVYFSGDGFALSDGDPYTAASSVNFEPLLPGGQADVILGRLAGPSTIPSGTGAGGETPGTYSMVQADPNSLSTPPTRITALQGTWRDHFRQRVGSSGNVSNVGYLSNVHAFEMITIPSSSDDQFQDLIAIAETITTNADKTQSVTITNCYFGNVNYATGVFQMYPIKNITSIIGGSGSGTSTQGQVSGTISATLNAAGVPTSSYGAVRTGSFAISSGGTPTGFPASGRFVVLRR